MNIRTRLISYLAKRDRGWQLLLCAAVLVLYLPFLGSPFVFDDLPFFFNGAVITYAHSWFHFDLRWLSYVSLGWTYTIFDDAFTHFYHLGNVLLHAGNVILLFHLLRQLVGAAVPDIRHTLAISRGAWFGALIYAVHPVAVYAAGYVVQRSILMATTFALVMALAYLRGLVIGQARWMSLAVTAYFLAVFSKEHSVMMPAVLVAAEILMRGKNLASKRVLWLTWISFFLIGSLIILRAKGVFGTPYEVMAADLFEQQGIIAGGGPALHLLSILTQAGLFFKYLLLWVFPNPAWMSVDMRESFIPALSDWRGWAGAVAFICYGACAAWLLWRGGRMGLLGFAALSPWLLFLVEFSSIRVQEPFVLYRSYLWFPWATPVLALWASRNLAGKGMWVFVTLVVLLLGAGSFNRLSVFAGDLQLWDDAARLLHNGKEAGASRIYFNRGQAELAVRRIDDGIADLQRAVALDPQLPLLHASLGKAYLMAGREREARVEFDTAIGIDPSSGYAYYLRAVLLQQQKERKMAKADLEKSCELQYVMACLILRAAAQR